MEDFKIDLVIGQGPAARTVRLDLPPFTLVGATTRAGLLTSPLRDRFGVVSRLEFYTRRRSRRIVARSARPPRGAMPTTRASRDRAALARHAADRQPPAAAGPRLRAGRGRRRRPARRPTRAAAARGRRGRPRRDGPSPAAAAHREVRRRAGRPRDARGRDLARSRTRSRTSTSPTCCSRAFSSARRAAAWRRRRRIGTSAFPSRAAIPRRGCSATVRVRAAVSVGRLLLHVCCAPCAAYPVPALRALGQHVAGYLLQPEHPARRRTRAPARRPRAVRLRSGSISWSPRPGARRSWPAVAGRGTIAAAAATSCACAPRPGRRVAAASTPFRRRCSIRSTRSTSSSAPSRRKWRAPKASPFLSATCARAGSRVGGPTGRAASTASATAAACPRNSSGMRPAESGHARSGGVVIDLHTHIIPGLDHGPGDWDEAPRCAASPSRTGSRRLPPPRTSARSSRIRPQRIEAAVGRAAPSARGRRDPPRDRRWRRLSHQARPVAPERADARRQRALLPARVPLPGSPAARGRLHQDPARSRAGADRDPPGAHRLAAARLAPARSRW